MVKQRGLGRVTKRS